MINLYNTHTKQYLKLKSDTSFTFQAQNQMQDLTKYNVGFSFDMELVNDENARDAVLYQPYKTGTSFSLYLPLIGTYKYYNADYPRVILYKDGNPLFIGKLVYISSTLTTVKVAYKCVPYGPAFRYFDMRSQIKDYFLKRSWQGAQIRTLFLSNTAIWNVTSNRKDTTVKIGYPVLVCQPENANSAMNFPASVTIPKDEQAFNIRVDSKYREYWMSMGIDQLLECMGIESTSDDTADCDMIVPMKPYFKRELRVRMYRSKAAQSTVRQYLPTATSEIWWRSDYTDKWELLSGGYANGVYTSVFKESIRKDKALSGMKLKDIIFPKDFGKIQYGCIGLNTYNGMQSVDFGLSYGHSYKDGDALTFMMTNVEGTAYSPSYIDVIFDFELEFNINSFSQDINYFNLYKDTPIMAYDIQFFYTETSKFLNELSLNNSHYKWLRNPAFFNTYNYKLVHGQNSNIYAMATLGQDTIESIKKERSYDKPSSISITVPTGMNTVYTKQLNSYGNDPKEIKHNFTGLSLINVKVKSNYENWGCPPLIYNLEKKEYVDNDIQGCFGTITYGKTTDKSTPRKRGDESTNITHHWRGVANADFDYMTDYSDKSDKYTIVCTNYNFEEEVLFENQLFVVDKYKTTDFVKFELECYPITRVNDVEFEDDSQNNDISGTSSGTDDLYKDPNTRPVRNYSTIDRFQ